MSVALILAKADERRINSSDGHRPPLQLISAKAFTENGLQWL